MEAKKDLPLCGECERLKREIEQTREEADDLERRHCEAENDWARLTEKLEAHESEEHGEDDPWLLHQLAEKAGQINFITGANL